ncbi:MAG: thioredoxin TrxC [Bdellovibrionales bacterium]|nr:thioredoxin TrxC [Bdellovibrionales bacterium]
METYAPCPKCNRLNRVPLKSEQGGSRPEPVCGACKIALPVHGAVVEVNAEGLQKLIDKSPIPVVVDFWAPWCGPCRMFAPTYMQVAGAHSGSYVFAKVDTEANPMVGDRHRIRSIPTLAIFKNGTEVQRQSGAMNESGLKQWLGLR